MPIPQTTPRRPSARQFHVCSVYRFNRHCAYRLDPSQGPLLSAVTAFCGAVSGARPGSIPVGGTSSRVRGAGAPSSNGESATRYATVARVPRVRIPVPRPVALSLLLALKSRYPMRRVVAATTTTCQVPGSLASSERRPERRACRCRAKGRRLQAFAGVRVGDQVPRRPARLAAQRAGCGLLCTHPSPPDEA